MNHRYLTTTLSALVAGACFSVAQEPLTVQSDVEPKQKEPAIVKDKDFHINTDRLTVTGGTKISGAKGKATITIDINGKKETREIDLGNAGEIKIVTGNKDVVQTNRVTFLGVAPEELSEELASQLPIDPGSGLLVRSIIPDSPAAAAGLQKNDVLIKLDDQTLTAPKQLQKLVASRKAGETVRVTYFRRGQRADTDAKLAEHEEPANAKFDLFLDALSGKRAGESPVRVPFDPLTFQKKIVIVDKEGNVVSKDEPEGEHADAIKRLAAEVERMRDQAAAAQKQAQEAFRHAEQAAREAAEIARKEASTAIDRMRDTVRKLQDQLERQEKSEKKEQ